MRALWGFAGVVAALAVVGIVFKKQMSAIQGWMLPGQTAQQRAQQQDMQFPQKVKEHVEGLLQQPRPMPEEQRQDE